VFETGAISNTLSAPTSSRNRHIQAAGIKDNDWMQKFLEVDKAQVGKPNNSS
jgi:hypothetical protein